MHRNPAYMFISNEYVGTVSPISGVVFHECLFLKPSITNMVKCPPLSSITPQPISPEFASIPFLLIVILSLLPILVLVHFPFLEKK